ncbi:MAG: type II toxin-antitoxin system HicA family toxin [Candidatus Paceibacterota bacterium]|jgi:predicted RNA binding protein YcfA (HicA-like mRNA interferase family)
MRPLTAKRIITILEMNGFVLSRQKGSHHIFYNEETGVSVPVPCHGSNKVIPIGTFLAIVKQSKISRNKFSEK